MMKQSTELVIGTVAAVFFAAVFGWLFCLSQFNNTFTMMTLQYLPLTVIIVLYYYVNYFLLRKGMNATLFLFMQIVLIAGAEIALCRYCLALEPWKKSTVVFLAVVYGAMLGGMAYTAYEPVKRNGLLLRFDITVIMILLLLFIAEFRTLSSETPTLVMCGIAFAGLLLALILERAGQNAEKASVRGSRSLGPVLMTAILAATVGLTALLITLFRSGARSVADTVIGCFRAIFKAIGSAARFIFRGMEQIMDWLVSFVGETDPVELAADLSSGGASGGGEEYLPEKWLPAWAPKLFLILTILVCIILLIRIRKKSAFRVIRRTAETDISVHRENGLSSALKRVLFRLKCRIKNNFNYIKFKKTVPGLLIWCGKRVQKSSRQRAGESGEAFLRRLAAETASPALLDLADAVEKTFYAPVPEAVSAELYHRIRKIKFT